MYSYNVDIQYGIQYGSHTFSAIPRATQVLTDAKEHFNKIHFAIENKILCFKHMLKTIVTTWI